MELLKDLFDDGGEEELQVNPFLNSGGLQQRGALGGLEDGNFWLASYFHFQEVSKTYNHTLCHCYQLTYQLNSRVLGRSTIHYLFLYSQKFATHLRIMVEL